MKKINVSGEKRVFNGYLKVDKAFIEEVDDNGSIVKYDREKLSHPDAVAGLIYNTDSESVILVKQFRYPAFSKNNNGFLYEAVAGKVDKNEQPLNTFIREAYEEVGYKIKEKNVEYCFSCFSSPGYSTERIHYFLATVSNKDLVKNAGGGLVEENESIEVCEIHYLQFRSMMDSLQDAKTKILAYESHYRKFFDKK